ncbi:MAG: hypothetical protein CO128_03160 [Ignavibacteriales bacterium CG_4_9_14_3_um_filter_30_11]|nr:MAG: hypothetical protein CO128_03160 [Ignavibacteriales bacterium CG_4_9_14_3_um_filter_30_11]
MSFNTSPQTTAPKGGPVLRDIGVALRGAWEGNIPGGYEAGIISGNGGNKTDNNSNKDFYGRGWISPLKGLLVGVSGLGGKEGPFATFESKRGITIWGVDASFEYEAFRSRVEYLAANYNSTTGAAEESPHGFYLWAGYKVIPSLEVLARYDELDINPDVSGQKINYITLGVTYTFIKGTHFMINYIIRNADDTLNLARMRNSEMVPAGLGLTTKPGFSATNIGNILLAQLQVSI